MSQGRASDARSSERKRRPLTRLPRSVYSRRKNGRLRCTFFCFSSMMNRDLRRTDAPLSGHTELKADSQTYSVIPLLSFRDFLLRCNRLVEFDLR